MNSTLRDPPSTTRPFPRPLVYRHFHRLAWLACALAFGVIVFGAFVRLSNAGLSCPDWPTCYGRAAWPTSNLVDHVATAIRPVEVHKAWREQLHRMLAGSLGVLVLTLALLSARRRGFGMAQIVLAAIAIAVSVTLYMRGAYPPAAVLAAIGEGVLLFAAVRWSNEDFARVSALTLAMVIFQALLGMWTVTWLLKPIVVMGHLLGGLLTFALLTWTAWRATDLPLQLPDARIWRRLLILALTLLGIQIALGGWTSSNYAALACGTDFPRCVGQWWPPHDFREGFVLWRDAFIGNGGVDYEGGVLTGGARIAIQLAHRMMALVVFVYLSWLSLRLWRTPGVRGAGATLAALVIAQVCLGIANVKLALPLPIAVLHNAGAALLLFVLVGLAARIRSPEA
ncbi:MAG: cytochrome oxidase assembly family protein [Xanthomonadaceae bacterium]|nr:cytochrome oxidase assembly family protein [Xanthomonadaceae bacterium]